MKKIAWIDTIRVLAALMIIFAHYFMCDGFKQTAPYFRNALSYDVAITGVFLFLAISGYLIPSSLARTPNLWQFYKRKFIRIVVPFTVSYIIMTAALIIPAIFNERVAERLPLTALLHGGEFLPLLYGMFPVDLNMTKLFGVDVYWFVGEWFMGTILWLYLLSPLLNYGAKKFPAESLALSIIVSCIAYYTTQNLALQGIIHDSWSLFVVRIPEFLFGMILFLHRDRLKKIRIPLVLVLVICFAAYVVRFVMNFPPQGAFFFMASPLGFAVTLPAIYLLFNVAELLNALHLQIFDWFNGLNGASYIAMIIQHVVIYLFADSLRFENLNLFGRFAVLLLIIAITFKAAQLIKKLSDPIEKIISQ